MAEVYLLVECYLATSSMQLFYLSHLTFCGTRLVHTSHSSNSRTEPFLSCSFLQHLFPIQNHTILLCDFGWTEQEARPLRLLELQSLVSTHHPRSYRVGSLIAYGYCFGKISGSFLWISLTFCSRYARSYFRDHQQVIGIYICVTLYIRSVSRNNKNTIDLARTLVLFVEQLFFYQNSILRKS